ncbi:hypothetical protein C8Q75DRAFT_737699 [Abortiporus biennis]|nr:hypothetical protein C8Q75DRAFT_737699 [Abortiporus biennis]
MKFLTFAIAFFYHATTTYSTPIQSPVTGTVSAPTPGEDIAPGSTFSFHWQENTWCNSGYSSFTAYLYPGDNSAAPGINDVSDSGVLENALFNFGTYVVANFGLPRMGTPPPSALAMPDLSAVNGESFTNANFFITLVENYFGCPPDISVEYGLISIPIVYNGTLSS